jgi:TRAP-type uncharacterized transport system substrate-binding protein
MLERFKQNKQRYRQVRLMLLIASAILISLAGFEIWYHWLRDSSTQLRISAGPSGTRRHDLVDMLHQAVIPNDLHFTIVETSGTEETLKLVNQGELDLAIVSSGMNCQSSENIREVASLPVEPAHLLIKKELAKQTGSLREILAGKRINVGVPGTCSYALAHEILVFTAQHAGHSTGMPFTLTHLSMEDLVEKAKAVQHSTAASRGELIAALPDAVLLVVSMPSRVAQTLIESAGYQLVPLAFSRAFISHNLMGSAGASKLLDHSYMEQITIPAGSYLGETPLPVKDCETIGIRLLLVANRNVPVREVFRVMTGLFEGEFARRVKPVEPEKQASPYPLHLGAKAYQQRNKPILNDVLEWGKKIMSALGLFSAGAISLYALLRTRKQKSANDYLNDIQSIDELAKGIIRQQPTAEETTSAAQALDDRLTAIKSELIQACCKKSFKNEMTLLNILTILADTRSQVSALMLKNQYQAKGTINRCAA